MTREEIMAARTPNGGWTRKQLAAWGVEWPPQKGWIDRITASGSDEWTPARCHELMLRKAFPKG